MTSNSRNGESVNANAHGHTINFNLDLSAFRDSNIGSSPSPSEETLIPPNVLVRNCIPTSNETFEGRCGKPKGETCRDPQSDREACFSDRGLFDGKPSCDIRPQENTVGDTQFAAHASEHSEASSSDTYLNSSGKPSGDIHSSGLKPTFSA